MSFSTLILTLNEERNLPRVLASLAACDDIVVLDSGSTDRTVEIARAAGARVYVRAFDNFACQRNYAQTNISFRHTWVFHLDADEELTPELAQACGAINAASEVDGYYVAPRMLFHGRWIRRSTDYPAWQARFVRAPGFEFTEVGHGQREKPGMRMGWLRENYLHHVCLTGDAEWLAKHRRYATAEAHEFLTTSHPHRWRELFARDPLVRRRLLKRISLKLPFRPILRFVYQYGLRGGFLDGRAGWHYCRLLSSYERFIVQEIRRQRLSSR